jgi:hypothetical protein
MKNWVHFLLGAVLAGSSAFGGLIVNEPPDFPASNPTSYNLTDGVNIFTGTVSGCPNCGGDFQDRFILVLPPGGQFVSGFLSGSYTAGAGTNPQGACFTGQGCFFTGFFSGFSSSVFAGGQYDFTASSPYAFSDIASFSIAAENAGSSSYTLSVTVAAPEPSTVLLVVPVLAGLALWSRRRKNLSA